jgi:hypothetical protein
MYLNATKHVSGYDFQENTEIETYEGLFKLAGFKDGDIQKHTPSGEIKLCVAYWRKANQIHNWFVKNVQDGVDECQSSYVERDQLNTLRETCKQVINEHDLAKTLLPTGAGFFFGGTDYDEDYFQDLENTIEQLSLILDNPKFDGWNFCYDSSW